MMAGITEQAVREALRGVQDPDLHRDIVELGFVKDVKISDGRVAFTIELTTPACPVRQKLQDEARSAVLQVAGVKEVSVNMTAKVTAAAKVQDLLPTVKNLVAVGSGKGGVGKSTVACGLAVALAKEGAEVGLMDLDVWGPSVPLMMGIREMPRVLDKKLIPIERYGVKVMSIGFFLKEDDPVIWRGPMVHGLLNQFAKDVQWGELDYMICDLPPGTGDVQISLCKMLPPTGAVIVSTPQDVALQDARKAISMFRKVGTPVLGIVENMSNYECPHCGNRMDIFGYGGAEKASKVLGIPFLGRIPIDVDIRIGGDRGEPLAARKTDTETGKVFQEAARKLAAQVSIENAKPKSEPEAVGVELAWSGVPASVGHAGAKGR